LLRLFLLPLLLPLLLLPQAAHVAAQADDVCGWAGGAVLAAGSAAPAWAQHDSRLTVAAPLLRQAPAPRNGVGEAGEVVAGERVGPVTCIA
jgi:hypothetical protein